MINIIFAIVSFYVVGITLLSFFKPKELSLPEMIGLSYGLGIGAICLQMLLYQTIGIGWSGVSLLLPWLAVVLFCFYKGRYKLINYNFEQITKNRKIIYLLLSLIMITVVYVFFESIFRPVDSWDAWANWFLAGKAFFINGAYSLSFIHFANNSSPPVIYLMISFVYIVLGHVDDKLALLPFAFFYFSLLLIFYGAVRKRSSVLVALIFTLLLATIQNFIRHAGFYDVGDSDLAVGYFFFCSCVCYLYYLKNSSKQSLFLFSIFLVISAFIKEEGIPFLLIGVLISSYTIIKSGKFSKLLFLLIPILSAVTFELFVHLNHLPTTPFVRTQVQFVRIPIVLWSFILEFFNVKRWNLLWLAFFSILFLKKSKEINYLLLFLFLQLLIYFGVYLMTPWDPAVHIANSFDRLLLHLAPIGLFIISIVYLEIIPKKFIENKK